MAGLPWLDGQAARLDMLREQVTWALSEARLAAGEHAQLVPELEQMAAGHRLDEQVHAQLILALYRSGRQADALAVYQRLRETLAEELGIDPSQALRDLETAILRRDSSLAAPSAAVALLTAPHAALIPAQLPPAVRHLVGREAELASLDAMLAETAGAASVVIAAITGTAGVGKTTLAVHWAHRVREQFPDGQLYVNLRGFSPGDLAADPASALRGFLDAFAVPPERIPADTDARSGLYRSLLAGKRVLVVLDNARDADQVRPLLPGAPGCLALITSRDQLTGLIATEGARPLDLDLLTDSQAQDLLASRIGANRVGSEPGRPPSSSSTAPACRSR